MPPCITILVTQSVSYSLAWAHGLQASLAIHSTEACWYARHVADQCLQALTLNQLLRFACMTLTFPLLKMASALIAGVRPYEDALARLAVLRCRLPRCILHLNPAIAQTTVKEHQESSFQLRPHRIMKGRLCIYMDACHYSNTALPSCCGSGWHAPCSRLSGIP